MVVTVAPCPKGNCRTGHTLSNLISGLIMAELFGWRYEHQRPTGKHKDEADSLYDFRAFTNSSKAGPRVKLSPLDGRHAPKKKLVDPGIASYASDERFGGHVSWERVKAVADSKMKECRKKGGGGREGKTCVLELQYGWRITLMRHYIWSMAGKVSKESHQRVITQLKQMYCSRMASVPQVSSYLYSTSVGATIAVHARRGDRKQDWLLKWGGDSESIVRMIAAVESAAAKCGMTGWNVTVHSEPDKAGELEKLEWKPAPSGSSPSRRLHTTNSLVLDFAMMVSSDVFILSSSGLSSLISIMRSSFLDGGGASILDVRLKILKAQYADDPISSTLETNQARWNKTRLLDSLPDCKTLFPTNREPFCAARRKRQLNLRDLNRARF